MAPRHQHPKSDLRLLKSTLLFYALLPLLVRCSSDSASKRNTADAEAGGFRLEHPQCRLFLAESTIPNAGLGIFSGVDLEPEEAIAEPDIIVPIADVEWNAGQDMDFHLLWADYSWMLQEVGMHTDVHEGSALVIGTGCMPNCNYALINAREGVPDYDHAGLHRSKDVGVGGFTGFYNQKMITTGRNIPAGGEIFVDYGHHWFQTRVQTMGYVPFERNYENIDKFLKKFQNFAGKYQTSKNPDFMKDLWEVVTDAPFESRNSKALPLSFEDMQSALSIGSAETRLPYSVRSLEWLNEHGRCMDNIRPGNSTIPQAGRGAFATRLIKEGGLVAPGPVLHIPNRTSLNLYEVDPETGQRDPSKKNGMQLILNYCFGHKKSSVLLCPYTSPSAYINHNSGSPNAKIVWAKDSTHNHNPDWLLEDVSFLKRKEMIGLSIDFIATRDIQPGEEVFIDYGPEWEEAWNKHVSKWKPPVDSENYVPAVVFEKDQSATIRTVKEQKYIPYPKNIVFYCHYQYEHGLDEGPWEWEDVFMSDQLYPCNIIRRNVGTDASGNKQYLYDAVMLTEDDIILDEIQVFTKYVIPSGEKHILTRVPRSAIEIKDKMYAKDEYQPNAFRHELMFPDDIFPESWKNL